MLFMCVSYRLPSRTFLRKIKIQTKEIGSEGKLASLLKGGSKDVMSASIGKKIFTQSKDGSIKTKWGGGGEENVRLSGKFRNGGTEPAEVTRCCKNGSDKNRGEDSKT